MNLPLQGRRILVTRSLRASGSLVERLGALGATSIEVPSIEISTPEDIGGLDRALGQEWDFVAFTSRNAVEAVAARLRALGLPLLGRLACVGPATRAALREAFPSQAIDVEPESDFRAEGLLEALSRRVQSGQRVLLPISDRARDVLEKGLESRGASVTAVLAYRTVLPEGLADRLRTALESGIDLALFASPSAVEGLVRAGAPAGLPVAVLGPVTEEAAREAGFDVRVVARPSTIEALVAAVAEFFSR